MSRKLPSIPPSTLTEVGQTCVAFNLRRADRLISQIYDGMLREVGIKGTQFTLMVTMKAKQPVPLSALANQLDVDRTTLTRNLSVLEKSGMVTFERGEDLRERRLSLTSKGEAALERAMPAWHRAQAHMETVLGGPAIKKLVEDLKKLAASVG